MPSHYLADELDAQRHSKAERHRVGRRHKLAVRAAAWQARRATPAGLGKCKPRATLRRMTAGVPRGIVLAGVRCQARKAGQT
jgi:hypothetical protein